MALWRISVKRTGNINGIRLEQGMFVEMTTTSTSDPLRTNISQNAPQISRLFENKYGIDLLKKGMVTGSYLDSTRIQ